MVDEKGQRRASINPYGKSKLMVDVMLKNYAPAFGLKSVLLLYIDAADTDPNGKLGECHDPDANLVPLVLHAAYGRQSSVSAFCDDYEIAKNKAQAQFYFHDEPIRGEYANSII